MRPRSNPDPVYFLGNEDVKNNEEPSANKPVSNNETKTATVTLPYKDTVIITTPEKLIKNNTKTVFITKQQKMNPFLILFLLIGLGIVVFSAYKITENKSI